LNWHDERFGDGSRPALFWKLDARNGLPVPPSDGSEEDTLRFRKERRQQDLIYLIRHGALTAKEKKNLRAELDEIAETEIWEP
jgi:hypothetical protein